MKSCRGFKLGWKSGWGIEIGANACTCICTHKHANTLWCIQTNCTLITASAVLLFSHKSNGDASFLFACLSFSLWAQHPTASPDWLVHPFGAHTQRHTLKNISTHGCTGSFPQIHRNPSVHFVTPLLTSTHTYIYTHTQYHIYTYMHIHKIRGRHEVPSRGWFWLTKHFMTLKWLYCLPT